MQKRETLINSNTQVWSYLKEAIAARDILFMLAWRDILIRYKRTTLGLGWSLLRPLLTMAVFVIVFGKVAKLPSNGVPYSLLVLSGLLPWMFFSNTLAIGAVGLIDNSTMLRRTYFPRIIIPTTSVLIHLSDAILCFIVFLGLSFYLQSSIDFRVLFFPLLMFHTLLLTLGVIYFLSMVVVRWRDVTFLIPFAIQIGFFVSPIGYTTTLVPDWLRPYFNLNPMVGLIEAFRWILLPDAISIHWDAYFISLGISLILFFGGLIFFIVHDRKVTDIL